MSSVLPHIQWQIQGGGLFFGKYFKKSPKLVKIYKKILGASQNPGRPPFFRSWIRH